MIDPKCIIVIMAGCWVQASQRRRGQSMILWWFKLILQSAIRREHLVVRSQPKNNSKLKGVTQMAAVDSKRIHYLIRFIVRTKQSSRLRVDSQIWILITKMLLITTLSAKVPEELEIWSGSPNHHRLSTNQILTLRWVLLDSYIFCRSKLPYLTLDKDHQAWGSSKIRRKALEKLRLQDYHLQQERKVTSIIFHMYRLPLTNILWLRVTCSRLIPALLSIIIRTRTAIEETIIPPILKIRNRETSKLW